MRKLKQKRCPRCQELFECKFGSILLCQCQAVYLMPEYRESVSKQHTDCLCAGWRQAVRRAYEIAQLTKQNDPVVGTILR